MTAENFEDYWRRRHEKLAGKLAAVGHSSAGEDKNTRAYAWKKRATVDLLRELGGVDLRGRSVLDAGCGIGLLSELFFALGADVCGIDISPVAIGQAQLRCPEGSFQAGSLTTFDFGRTFDFVISADVLYHVVDDDAWRQVLARLARHCHGRIALLDQLRREITTPGPHVRYRTLPMYEEAFAALGFKPTRVESEGFVVFAPG